MRPEGMTDQEYQEWFNEAWDVRWVRSGPGHLEMQRGDLRLRFEKGSSDQWEWELDIELPDGRFHSSVVEGGRGHLFFSSAEAVNDAIVTVTRMGLLPQHFRAGFDMRGSRPITDGSPSSV